MKSCDSVRKLSRKLVCSGQVNVYNAFTDFTQLLLDPPEADWKDVSMSFQTPHPYLNAKYIRVIFDTIDTEAGTILYI